MKKKLLVIMSCLIFSGLFCGAATQATKIPNKNEFVVTKTKIKKESVNELKGDIGLFLESCHQQISKNIIELAQVQQQIFDKIKDLVGACDATEKSVFDGNATQLKEQRHKLQAFYEKLQRQEEQIQSFLTCF